MDFKKITAIIAIFFTVMIGTSGYLTSGFGILTKIDARYASAQSVKKLSVKIEFIGAQTELNHLRQLKSEALAEYFTAKKLKRVHPDDEEVIEMLELAQEQKKLITAEYMEMKKKVAELEKEMKK